CTISRRTQDSLMIPGPPSLRRRHGRSCRVLGRCFVWLSEFATTTEANCVRETVELSLFDADDWEPRVGRLLSLMFSLCKQPLAFLQLFLGLLVVKGKSLRCINLQAATEGGHRLAKELDGLGALAPNTLFCERNAQVVLIQCPFFRG